MLLKIFTALFRFFGFVKRHAIAFGVTALIALIGIGMLSGGGYLTPTETSATTSTASPSSSSLTVAQKAALKLQVPNAAVIQEATLSHAQSLVLYQCATDTDGLLPLQNFSARGVDPNDPTKLNNSFALALPLTGYSTPAATFAAWQTSMCEDPLEGVTYGWVLANTPLYGQLVGDFTGNSFMKFLVGMDESQLRAYVVKHFDPGVPTTKTAAKYVADNLAYKTFIDKTNTLYGQLANLGIDSFQSSAVWMTSGPSLGYPDIVTAPQESLSELTLGITQKGECLPVATIMINTLDQRPERGNLPGCIPTPNSVPTPNCKINCVITPPSCPAGEVPSNTPGYTNVCVAPKVTANSVTAPTGTGQLGVGGDTAGQNNSTTHIDPTTPPGAPVVLPAPGSTPVPTPKPSSTPTPPPVVDPPVTGPTPAPSPIPTPTEPTD
jgi:hypothetical protein